MYICTLNNKPRVLVGDFTFHHTCGLAQLVQVNIKGDAGWRVVIGGRSPDRGRISKYIIIGTHEVLGLGL